MKVIQCFQELIHYIFCFAFTQSTFTFFVTCDVGEQVTASAQLEKNMPSHMHLVKFKTEKARLAEQKAMVLFHGKDSIDIRMLNSSEDIYFFHET